MSNPPKTMNIEKALQDIQGVYFSAGARVSVDTYNRTHAILTAVAAEAEARGKAHWEPSEAHKEAWRQEGRREALEEVEDIEFFEWDEWTQKTIKARIRIELTK